MFGIILRLLGRNRSLKVCFVISAVVLLVGLGVQFLLT